MSGSACSRHRLALCAFQLLFLLIAGCAAPKSYVVLLPRQGDGAGEVVVTTSKGSQVLTEGWEKSEIRGLDAPPGAPVKVDDMAERSQILTVLGALPLQPARFTLFFYLNSTELVPESQRLLPEVVKSVRERPAAEVFIVGHTDTVASEPYNDGLGERRAEKVHALLKGMGAVPLTVVIMSRGEAELLVQTPDGTPEPRNRRAEVTVR